MVGNSADTAPDVSTVTVSQVVDTLNDISLGSLVNGTLSSPGATDQYQFTLTQGDTILLSALGGGASLALIGPGGQVIANNINSGNAGSYTLQNLAAGTYTIAVTGSGAATPAYSFGLQDLLSNAVTRAAALNHRDSSRQWHDRHFPLDTTPGEAYNLNFTTPPEATTTMR